MELEWAAKGFAAAGAKPRHKVLLDLVRAGPQVLTVGEPQERLNIPTSTLPHHLRFLNSASLIDQEKDGRTVINRARFDYIEDLAKFLLKECCTDPALLYKEPA